MEEWKNVIGYEGLYEVSNKGNVRNVRRNKLLRLSKTKYGYIQVGLSKNGIRTMFQVHRLVAQAFIENSDNLPQVNHKDEDKTNNNVTNLEWCDAKYNNNYGTARIRAKETAIKNGYWTGLSRKESNKKYYEENKKKINENNREYYEENKEKINEYMREYRKENKEKRREYMREYNKKYYDENKEKRREYMREYIKKRKNK